MMDDLIKTVETFLTYSDEKLEELSQKNQALKVQKTKENQNQTG